MKFQSLADNLQKQRNSKTLYTAFIIEQDKLRCNKSNSFILYAFILDLAKTILFLLLQNIKLSPRRAQYGCKLQRVCPTCIDIPIVCK